jgi:hypothetical protein
MHIATIATLFIDTHVTLITFIPHPLHWSGTKPADESAETRVTVAATMKTKVK